MMGYCPTVNAEPPAPSGAGSSEWLDIPIIVAANTGERSTLNRHYGIRRFRFFAALLRIRPLGVHKLFRLRRSLLPLCDNIFSL
jgi:hypothetical protein